MYVNVKRIIPKSSDHKDNLFLFLLSVFMYQYEMMDANESYHGNHFTINVSQTIM